MHCEQWEEGGSIPFVRWPSFADGHPQFESASSAVVSRVYSSIAQLVEQQTVNLWVTGSSPVRGAKIRSVGRTVMQQIANL